MIPLVSRRSGTLAGRCRVPGDKSISHRALMTAAIAIGRTTIEGLLEGEDVLRTADALSALGVGVRRHDDGRWSVDGVGVGGLVEPSTILDMGNSGTGARLMMGLVSTHAFNTHFTGDASLVKRPMARVARPLERMGASILARSGCRLPLAVMGTAEPVPIEYELPVASAQVKSAILYAALNAPGETIVIEPQATRDHSELMLKYFGATVASEPFGTGGRTVRLTGLAELQARDLRVPSDISSAAFPLVAAAITEGAHVTLEAVGTNPLRIGIVDTLREMGAAIRIENERRFGEEPVADIAVKGGALRAVDVPANRAPRMIDEYPVLAVAAACASGTSRFRGLGELRVKESDRLSAIADGLARCGVDVEVSGDDLMIEGTGRPPRGAATIATHLDHRIAMAFLVLGLVSQEPVAIDDGSPIQTSFPDFVPLMRALGAAIETRA
ncbi:MAG: 3-phosphoshikimate 1-carboxyvinyltransferase [Alphaproteobacteria bacterium]